MLLFEIFALEIPLSEAHCREDLIEFNSRRADLQVALAVCLSVFFPLSPSLCLCIVLSLSPSGPSLPPLPHPCPLSLCACWLCPDCSDLVRRGDCCKRKYRKPNGGLTRDSRHALRARVTPPHNMNVLPKLRPLCQSHHYMLILWYGQVSDRASDRRRGAVAPSDPRSSGPHCWFSGSFLSQFAVQT